MTDLKKIKLEDLRCVSENIDLDYYIEFRESVRSRMDEPEWLGEIPKEGLESMLSIGGKIWMYYLNDVPVCTWMFIPAGEDAKEDLEMEGIDYNLMGDIGPVFVNFDYLGNGLMYQMLIKFDEYLKSIGFHKTKSKYFKTIVSELLKIGYIPNDRDFLEKLPGVGRKTASVVLGQLYDEPSFAVDTHVYRTSKRLGITKDKDDVLKTEIKLKKYFDKETWNRVNSQLVLFGRYYCTSKNPKCDTCNLKCICKNKRK